ncbi:MAG TPA: nucleotide pyrophosphohydrolase [Longimicrobiales bacterium]|nr:nucleotide pyrophosphohydrolase [Longimicrobiales bacterium]
MSDDQRPASADAAGASDAADAADASDSPGAAGTAATAGAAGARGAGLTIADAQRAVDTWISQFEEGYWPPLSNLARLVEEVGELARELNHRHGHKPKKPDEPEQDLALELADVLFVLLTLANEQRIDLEGAFVEVLRKYEARDAARWTRKT